MTKTPIGQGKVSIVIPCYNHGAMLREALASVEQARNANVLEVIIVDDGSSEAETVRVLNELAEAGYCVVPQPNRRGGAARGGRPPLAEGRVFFSIGERKRLPGGLFY